MVLMVQRSVLYILMCLVSLIFAGGGGMAMASTVIVPIEEAALDELLGADGNRLVVTFVAAWCPPCIDELPILNKLYHKYKGKGLKMIGITMSDAYMCHAFPLRFRDQAVELKQP